MDREDGAPAAGRYFPWVKERSQAERSLNQQARTNWPRQLERVPRELDSVHAQIFQHFPLSYHLDGIPSIPLQASGNPSGLKRGPPAGVSAPHPDHSPAESMREITNFGRQWISSGTFDQCGSAGERAPSHRRIETGKDWCPNPTGLQCVHTTREKRGVSALATSGRNRSLSGSQVFATAQWGPRTARRDFHASTAAEGPVYLLRLVAHWTDFTTSRRAACRCRRGA
jgi:hypothetical protein